MTTKFIPTMYNRVYDTYHNRIGALARFAKHKAKRGTADGTPGRRLSDDVRTRLWIRWAKYDRISHDMLRDKLRRDNAVKQIVMKEQDLPRLELIGRRVMKYLYLNGSANGDSMYSITNTLYWIEESIVGPRLMYEVVWEDGQTVKSSGPSQATRFTIEQFREGIVQGKYVPIPNGLLCAEDESEIV